MGDAGGLSFSPILSSQLTTLTPCLDEVKLGGKKRNFQKNLNFTFIKVNFNLKFSFLSLLFVFFPTKQIITDSYREKWPYSIEKIRHTEIFGGKKQSYTTKQYCNWQWKTPIGIHFSRTRLRKRWDFFASDKRPRVSP